MARSRRQQEERKSTENLRGRESGLTRERMELLTRIYHSASYASEATGCAPNNLTRAARRYGLEFRHSRYRKEDQDG